MTEADVVNIREQLGTDPQFSPSLRQLLDLSEVTSLRVDSVAVGNLVRGDLFDAGARRAIVAPAIAVYGMMRMYELSSEESMPNLSVFRTAQEADAWLILED